MTLNGGTPDERQLAITQAYVIVGTPRAIQASLDPGAETLAGQADFQAMLASLPTANFATLYLRSSNFQTDLEPALKSILSPQAVDSTLQFMSAASLISFARTSDAPTVIGLALRADEQQFTVDGVANTPYDLHQIKASPVDSALLAHVPAQASQWAALNVDVAGLVQGINVPGLLGKALPTSNGIVQRILSDFAQSLQKLFSYAQGGVMITQLPAQNVPNNGNPGQAKNEIGLVLPMVDGGTGQVASALSGITNRLKVVGALSGLIQVQSAPATADRGEMITISSKALESTLPDGFQYALSSDNMLILTTGQRLDSFLATFKAGPANSINSANGSGAANEMQAILPGPPDRFVYAYADLARQNIPLTAAFGMKAKPQGGYLTLVLKAK